MIEVNDIFKSAFIWLRCEIRPTITRDENDPARIVFSFPDSEPVRSAVREYLAGEGGIKSFVEIYKILRSEMYLSRGKENGNRSEKYS